MQTFAFVSQKGGVGKSTLARQFAVLAGDGLLIDRDPQATTTKWWTRRQALKTYEHPDLLTLKPAETLTKAVTALKRAPGRLFIDTRPAVEEPEAEAARVADLIVVPVGTSTDDLEAVPATLKMIRRQGKPAVLVVNGARNVARALEARAALAQYPYAVCPFHLTHRTAYSDAHLKGLGVSEDKGALAADAAAEMRAVWTWVQEQAHG